MLNDEEGASTLGRLEYPDLDLKGGLGSKFPLFFLIKVLMDDPRGQANRFQTRDPYHLVRREAFLTVLTPPPRCTAMYYKAMESGIQFPVIPFVKECALERLQHINT